MDMMELLTEINKDKINLRRNQMKAKEDFDKKQLEDLKEFEKKANSRQDQLIERTDAQERGVVASEKRIKNFDKIIQV
jgi:hypothetical protein